MTPVVGGENERNRMHMRTCALAHIHTHTRTHACTHARTQAGRQARTRTHTQTHVPKHTPLHPQCNARARAPQQHKQAHSAHVRTHTRIKRDDFQVTICDARRHKASWTAAPAHVCGQRHAYRCWNGVCCAHVFVRMCVSGRVRVCLSLVDAT